MGLLREPIRMTNTIYALVDPTTHCIRYVGYTKQSLKQRLNNHMAPSRLKKDSKKNIWLRSLNTRPIIIVLEKLGECSQKYAESSEIFWIRLLRMAGNDLTNETIGGKNWN